MWTIHDTLLRPRPLVVSVLSLDEGSVSSLVSKVDVELAARIAMGKMTVKSNNWNGIEKAQKATMKGTMKWLPFMPSFVFEKMCELIDPASELTRTSKKSICLTKTS
jgi:hypothetical protein